MPGPQFLCSLATACLLLGSTSATAQVFAPRVVPAAQPDRFSPRTLSRFPAWQQAAFPQRVRLVFDWFTSAETGLRAFPAEPQEGADTAVAPVTDSTRLLNVYGFGNSRSHALALAGLWQQAGFGTARVVLFPGWKQGGEPRAAVELSDGKQRAYVDPYAPALFPHSDGRPATLEEVLQDETLWNRESSGAFFPGEQPAEVRRQMLAAPPQFMQSPATAGRMNYLLRPGESLIRWWKPQEPRWHQPAGWKSRKEVTARLTGEPASPRSASGATVASHGKFVYQPDLTDASADLAHALWDSHNVVPGKQGLTLQEPGAGFAIFEFTSPWTIIPLVGKPEDPKDDSGAATVEADGQSLRVEVSVDQAVTWDPLTVKQLPARLDLTKQTAGRTSYLVRISLKGKPGEAVLKSLTVTTHVQIAPAALPALQAGRNELTFHTGDADGQPARVVRLAPGCHSLTEFSRALVFPPREYQASPAAGRATGPFTIRLAAPPGGKFTHLVAGGAFFSEKADTDRDAGNENAKNSAQAAGPPAIEYAAGVPADFLPLAVFDNLPAGQAEAAAPLQLPEPAETVYLRYTGRPAVNSYHVTGYWQTAQPPTAYPLNVTWTWQAAGSQPRSLTRTLEQPGPFTIDAGPEKPENISVEFSVPSQPAP